MADTVNFRSREVYLSVLSNLGDIWVARQADRAKIVIETPRAFGGSFTIPGRVVQRVCELTACSRGTVAATLQSMSYAHQPIVDCLRAGHEGEQLAQDIAAWI